MDRDVPPWWVAPNGEDGAPAENGRGAGLLIMALVLASLTMAFGAMVTLYIYMWATAVQWPPPGTPALPRGLWLSTGLLFISSLTMQMGLRAARAGRWRRLHRAIAATCALACAFLISQAVNWGLAVIAHLPPGSSIYADTFYLITGLHAAHVFGGLVPLGMVWTRARRGAYTPARHAGVTYIAMYWHFLGVVWLLLFGVLLITGTR